MTIDLIPTLIDQFQETFEGEVAPGVCWITSGPADSAILGTLDALTPDQALTPPVRKRAINETHDVRKREGHICTG